MTDQLLQADLDALGRLLPQLTSLADEAKHDVSASIPADGGADGDTPSLAAAHEMSTRTLPTVQAAVAGRFGKVAELIEHARSGFITTDGQLQAAISTVPTLQPPPTGP
jgi:hypothetical protein